MRSMDIQAGIFPQGQTGGKKMSGLALTEIDKNLWPVFGQEQNLVWTLCKERWRCSKEMADNGQWQHILQDAGSAWAELIHTVTTAQGAVWWGQPGGSHHTAACQKQKTLTHSSTGNASDLLVMSWCNKTNFWNENWKLPCLYSSLGRPLTLLQLV